MIKRKIFKDLLKNLSRKEIALIIGARQVGKTTVMRLLEDYLMQNGEKTIFLNLDYDHDAVFFKSHDDLVAKLKLEFGTSKGFVFIDEIQRKENAGLFLKGLYDLDLPYKFIVSGSGSLELKEKIHESLAGRKRLFEMFPVDFEEFVDFKTGYKYEDRLNDFFAVEKNKVDQLLNEYLSFGGYPRVVLEESLGEKMNVMAEIVRSYLDKDIAYFFKHGNVEAFRTMVSLLGAQNGQLVNYSKLASLCGVSLPTLKKYLWYAEKTFVVHVARPFFKNVRKEITKSPIYYFTDLGFCNYALNSFGQSIAENRIGFLFQNFIGNILRQSCSASGQLLHFWRTKDKAEVDFVVFESGGLVPVEVKYKKMKKQETGRSLVNFIGKYKPKKVLIVNLSLDEKKKIGGTVVEWAPYWKL
ncbi:ATP-binding protein [Candidatus Peregrinibacteria bacterium]|nr:ATP-binding protein [Candidatus Peregrinibacteria bacterium]